MSYESPLLEGNYQLPKINALHDSFWSLFTLLGLDVQVHERSRLMNEEEDQKEAGAVAGILDNTISKTLFGSILPIFDNKIRTNLIFKMQIFIC